MSENVLVKEKFLYMRNLSVRMLCVLLAILCSYLLKKNLVLLALQCGLSMTECVYAGIFVCASGLCLTCDYINMLIDCRCLHN